MKMRSLSVVGLCFLLMVGLSWEVNAVETLYRDTPYKKFVAGGKRWLPNGDEKTQAKYIGEVKNGIPDGRGTLTDIDGNKYVGEFTDGDPNGQGTLTLSDGSIYVGQWKDGKWHGQGTLTWSNGNQYVGEYENGLADGQGTLTKTDGSKYVGEYKDDKPWNGTEHDKDGNVTATWSEGIRHTGLPKG